MPVAGSFCVYCNFNYGTVVCRWICLLRVSQ